MRGHSDEEPISCIFLIVHFWATYAGLSDLSEMFPQP